MEDFETQLKQMAENRKRKEQEFYNSVDGKLYYIKIDFICWCYGKGKFTNLDENDFKKYKKEFNINLEFSLEMLIYEKWFGYIFEYDSSNDKWITKQKGNGVLNESK